MSFRIRERVDVSKRDSKPSFLGFHCLHCTFSTECCFPEKNLVEEDLVSFLERFVDTRVLFSSKLAGDPRGVTSMRSSSCSSEAQASFSVSNAACGVGRHFHGISTHVSRKSPTRLRRMRRRSRGRRTRATRLHGGAVGDGLVGVDVGVQLLPLEIPASLREFRKGFQRKGSTHTLVLNETFQSTLPFYETWMAFWELACFNGERQGGHNLEALRRARRASP